MIDLATAVAIPATRASTSTRVHLALRPTSSTEIYTVVQLYLHVGTCNMHVRASPFLARETDLYSCTGTTCTCRSGTTSRILVVESTLAGLVAVAEGLLSDRGVWVAGGWARGCLGGGGSTLDLHVHVAHIEYY